MIQTAPGQSSLDLAAQPTTYPSIRQPDPERYNLKWRNLIARFRMSFLAEATDNLNLSDDDREADLGFGPALDAGFLWRITDANVLQVDAGIGYRWYIEHPSVQSLNVSPNTKFDYQVLLEHARISFHDNLSVQVDPTSRPDLDDSGGEDVTEFRRINNALGITAEWNPRKNLSLIGGYDYTIDRSLSGEFDNIDRDSHSFSLGSFFTLNPRINAGLSGYYSFSTYVQDVHNDSQSYGLGPVAILQFSQFLTAEASVYYSVSSFADNGSIGDSSDFSGLTGQLTVRHKLNSRMDHELVVSHAVQSALESNFYEITSMRYGINARVHTGLSLHSRLNYEYFETSGSPREKADRFGFYLGAGYQLRRNWQIGGGYTFQLKESNLPGHDYVQNRFTLELTRQF